ncbi:MAG: DegV family EDD domain-containing protein [Spirochaetes bacterium]|nr:DegV family EDD domain-containing protein [Spirochaetota bacterium]
MHEMLIRGITTGLERISAWSELLDRINVFPVADGDTGRNLKMSLTPLMMAGGVTGSVSYNLLLSARGNSGNIATQFFSGFITAETERDIAGAVALGRERAWKAVNAPRQGTMLTVFDSLNEFYRGEKNIFHTEATVKRIIERLDEAVKSTPDLLEKLRIAGVVDSGALGMFIFFEGFYYGLIGLDEDFVPVTERFGDMLSVRNGFSENGEEGYCIDTVLRIDDRSEAALREISASGESVIIIPEEQYVKVHLHARDSGEARRRLEALGSVVNWASDDLDRQIREFAHPLRRGPLHIMTDAAGSITRDDATSLGFTLLESYITVDNRALPETQFSPEELYRLMRSGSRASTSQASIFERHQCYASVMSQYERVLYLCVGSIFTGNWQVATRWKEEHDRDGRLTVIDTGTASGRLGVLAIAAARHAADAPSAEEAIDYALRANRLCDEYIFIDKLQYLATGGRLSKTSAFFGDMLHMKPVITPLPDGAKKVAVVRKGPDQIRYAMDRMTEILKGDPSPFIMLQYSDNRDWVRETVQGEVRSLFPGAEILLQPLSLTTGVHTGPGTWAVAFLPGHI